MAKSKAKSKLPKIAVVTGMWQRHAIFKIFIDGIRHLQEQFKDRAEIIACVSGSEGEVSRNMVEEHPGFYYVEVSNSPLSDKMNMANMLANMHQPDYYLLMGSDDIVNDKLLEQYLESVKDGIDYTYIIDCYFYDTVSRRSMYWAGYDQPHNIGKAAGIGRFISRNLMEKLKWTCWPSGLDRKLDSGFDTRLAVVKHTRRAVSLRKTGAFALDIKTPSNITKFESWNNTYRLGTKDMLFDNLPTNLAKSIFEYGSKSNQ